MNCDILHLNYEYDSAQLECESKFFSYRPLDSKVFENQDEKCFFDFAQQKDKYWWDTQETWTLSNKLNEEMSSYVPESFRILNEFKEILKTDEIQANFFFQEKNTEVKPHTDVRDCAINFLVKGNSTPIIFENSRTYFYNCALLNVSITHSVPLQTKTDRLLFKLGLLNMSFEEASKRIKSALF